MIPLYKKIGAVLNGYTFTQRDMTSYSTDYVVYSRDLEPVMLRFVAFNKTNMIQLVGTEDFVELGKPFHVDQLDLVITLLLD